MTTGSVGTFHPERSCNTRSWSGGDGRYMIVGGRQVEKFNAYNLDTIDQKITPDTVYGLNYCTVASLDASHDFDANDTIKLLSKLASSARTHDFHLGKFVAEGRQTVNLARDTIRTVGLSILDLKRGDFASAARRLGVNRHTTKLHLNDVAGRWLELQFGWLPLLSDVYESTRAFHALTSGPLNYDIYVGTYRSEVTSMSASPSNWKLDALIEYKQHLKYLWVEDLSAERSLGLEDPLGVAWEICPYSFVVDWFLPIGAYLEVLNIVPKLKGYWCKTQVRQSTTLPLVVKNINYYKGCTTSYRDVRVRRTVGQGFKALDIPLPTLKPIGKALSATHIYDAVALASQLISGRVRKDSNQRLWSINHI